ncbi:hypothetical protein DENSPDRAFT_843661 [Dentipellis sp. KUC8613]|nr:hypothetical protein DENSPDRAFT_843661 [Dentipellis sp. KUC8613]
MSSSNSASRSQPYAWTGSPGRVSGPSMYNSAQPASIYARQPHNTTHSSANTTAGDLALGSYPPTTSHTETYALDASLPHANMYQASAQESSASRVYGSQVDMPTSFSRGSGHHPIMVAPSTIPSATMGASPGHPATYGQDFENTTIHRGASRPPLMTEQAESSQLSHKRMSHKETTKAVPQMVALPDDNSDQQQVQKKKKKTVEEIRHRKALQARDARARYTGFLRELEDVLPENLKTYEDPLTRETIARGIRYIKEMRHELDTQNALLCTVQEEVDALRYECVSKNDAILHARHQIMMQQEMIHDLQVRMNYGESPSKRA